MPDDPRAKLFFDQWEKDTHLGITLRSVHNKLTGHVERTEERFRNQSGEMKKIGERVASVEQNDKRDAEDRARHPTPGGIVIPTPVQPFAPPPFTQPSAVVHVHGGNVGGDFSAGGSGSHIIPPPGMIAAAAEHERTTRRSTWPPAWLKAPLQKVVGYGLTALVAAGVTLGLHVAATPAPPAPTERVVYLPAPVETPIATVAATIGSAMPEAGAATANPPPSHHR